MIFFIQHNSMNKIQYNNITSFLSGWTFCWLQCKTYIHIYLSFDFAPCKLRLFPGISSPSLYRFYEKKSEKQRNYAIKKRWSRSCFDKNFYQVESITFGYLHHYTDSLVDCTLGMDAIFSIQETSPRNFHCISRNDTKQYNVAF